METQQSNQYVPLGLYHEFYHRDLTYMGILFKRHPIDGVKTKLIIIFYCLTILLLSFKSSF